MRRERWREGVPPLRAGGIVFAAAALWSVAQSRAVPAAVVIGVVGIGAAVQIATTKSLPVSLNVALTLPFAWVIAYHGTVADSTTIRITVVFAASVGAVLASRFDAAWRDDALGLPFVALAALGAYACVPDTEEAAALVGVALPLAFVGWPARFARLGAAGAATTIATFAWVAAIGGRSRAESVVGALVCLAVLVGWPLGAALRGRRAPLLAGVSPAAAIGSLAVGHAVIVFVGARVVGTGVSASVSLAALAAAVGAIVLGAAIRPPQAADLSERR
jgi:hypothetical protein